MKLLWRLVAVLYFLAGGVILFRLSINNHDLEEQIAQLEAELGRMAIDDPNRVYFVEIESPDVPPEVAAHLERVWQFRCYLPPGYDAMRFRGSGRVAKEGVYLDGGYGSSWSSPQAEGTHQLVTVSLQKKDGRLEVFDAFGGSSGTTSWGPFDGESGLDSLTVKKLVSSHQGARSFDRDSILPFLKVYLPSSAKQKKTAGREITTYSGGLFVLCPKSREPALELLKRGETPDQFDAGLIAEEAADE